MAKPLRLLIDSDSFVYSAGFAVESREYLVTERDDLVFGRFDDKRSADASATERGGTVWRRDEIEPLSHALHSTKLMIEKIIKRVTERYGAEPSVEVYLSGVANFRERLATIRPYKGNRDPRHKPVYMREIREYLVREWGATIVNWYEADDEVSILQTEDYHNTIVASIDKDLLQVPGLHYIPGKGFKTITPEVGLMRFYAQVLSGDTADNVAGCYRIGRKKAIRYVKDVGPDARKLWRITLEAYKASIVTHGIEACGYSDPEAAALENARLVYMLRERPFEPAYPELWSAPK